MTSALEVVDLTVAYGDHRAVDGVTFEVADAEIVALLGPSGCGKSTLLRAIAGIEPLGSGQIRWAGTDLARVPMFRRRFGLMFQDGVLFPHRTVAGNIGYGLKGQGTSATDARVRELLELVNLPGMGERRVGTLSGGQAQRVALARALAPRPRLLLLDEPLAALDTALREQLLVDLRQILRRTGTATVVVTHDQDEAFAIADRVAIMNDGRLRQVGPVQQVWGHPVDRWVAGFVGYSSVLDEAASARVRPMLGKAVADGAVALRPTALRVDPDGPLVGTLVGAVPGPDATLCEVELPGWGTVRAVGPGATGATGAAGAPGAGAVLGPVRLRFDPSGATVLPPGTLEP